MELQIIGLMMLLAWTELRNYSDSSARDSALMLSLFVGAFALAITGAVYG